MSERDEQQARLELQEVRLRLAYAAVCLGLLGWYLIPDHRKEQARMRARRAVAPAVRSLLETAHQAAVTRAMAREAATGTADYALAERLRAARDRWAG